MKSQPSRLPAICIFVLVAFGAANARGAEEPERVPRWSCFELTLSNSKHYADPYRDVTLDVTFTRPDGRAIAFWGFYDGGDTWRARFMPDSLGAWRYEAKFSDGSDTVRGAFECVASDLPGQVSVHAANPQWFGWRGGDSVLLRALHVGDRFFARNWDDPATSTDGDRRTAFLDWAQRQGYNTLSIASHYLTRNARADSFSWPCPGGQGSGIPLLDQGCIGLWSMAACRRAHMAADR